MIKWIFEYIEYRKSLKQLRHDIAVHRERYRMTVQHDYRYSRGVNE